MKIKFEVSWQTYCVGDVIEPSAMQACWLIANGYAVPVGVELEAATAPACECAVAQKPKRRGPGRPRKREIVVHT